MKLIRGAVLDLFGRVKIYLDIEIIDFANELEYEEWNCSDKRVRVQGNSATGCSSYLIYGDNIDSLKRNVEFPNN